MVIYCPQCYHANANGATVCERCGASLALRENETFTDRLLWGLQHPEPTVPPRVAWILGERGDRKAIPALCGFIRAKPDDPLFLEEAVLALGKLRAEAAVPLIATLLDRSFVSVSIAAANALNIIGTEQARQALAEAARHGVRDSVRRAAQQALHPVAPGDQRRPVDAG